MIHGHHRYIAARIASAVTGRPLTGGRNPIIPDRGFEAPKAERVEAERDFNINVKDGHKPADGTTNPTYGTGQP